MFCFIKENFRMNIQLQPSPSNTEILDQGIEELKNYIKVHSF